MYLLYKILYLLLHGVAQNKPIDIALLKNIPRKSMQFFKLI